MFANDNRVRLADALDRLDEAEAALLSAPLHTLNSPQLLELIHRLEALERRIHAHQQRLIGRLATQSRYRSRATPPVDLLAKALRIPRAEAQRRITEAMGAAAS